MTKPSQERHYYFDDKDAPGGWRTYHLWRRGETLDLFRIDGMGNSTPIRQAVTPELAREGRYFEQGVYRLLEHFLLNPGRRLLRADVEQGFGSAVGQYLGRMRILFDDPLPCRLIQCPPGDLCFAPDVRETPSIFHSAYRKDLAEHWKPLAVGLGATDPVPLFQSGQWYFSGRKAVLQHIVQWLAQESAQGDARVVTGYPGCGKSAVLGYIVTASDRGEIEQPGLKELLKSIPEDALPKPGGIDFAIDLRRKTLDETLNLLGDCFRCGPKEVIGKLTDPATGKTVLVFDGLDEAREPLLIANQLLRILTGYSHLWLLIGCQRPHLPRLGGSVVALDLDGPEFRDDANVAMYVKRILLANNENRHSPYRGDEPAAHKTAELVAEAANGNFLVAFVIARSLVEGLDQPHLDRETFPRTPKDAFDHYLHRLGKRSGLGHATLRQALTPLAYGRGEGQPLDVWELLAKANVHDILELAAAFITKHKEEGHTVYRLYHESLAEALRDPDPEQDAEMQREITSKLIAAAPDWFQSDWYTRKYLAQHAAAGGVLDPLVLDTKFLTVTDPPEFLRVADGTSSDEARRRVSWYRLTADRLAKHSDFGERLSYLELTARQHGAADLADSANARENRRWTVPWAHWNSEAPHIVLRGHTGEVHAVVIHGEIVISGGEDATIRFWNRRNGALLVPPLLGHTGRVEALAVGPGKVLSGGADGVVRVWDLTTGDADAPLGTHPSSVIAVVASRHKALSASQDGLVILWDLSTGEEIERRFLDDRIETAACCGNWFAVGSSNGDVLVFKSGDPEVKKFQCEGLRSLVLHEDVLVIGCTDRVTQIHNWQLSSPSISEFDVFRESFPFGVIVIAKDRDVIATAGGAGVVRFYDLEAGLPTIGLLRGHESLIQALAFSGGLIASGSTDGTIRLWDLGNIGRIGHLEDSTPTSTALCAFENVVVGATKQGLIRQWDVGVHDSIDKVIDARGVWRPAALAIDSSAIMALSNGYDDLMFFGCYEYHRWERKSGSSTVQWLPLGFVASAAAMTRDLVVMGFDNGWVHVFPITNGLIEAGAICASMRMHGSEVIALAIAGRTVVSSGRDRTLRLWDTATDRETHLELSSPYLPKALGLGNRVIAMGNENGELLILDRRSCLITGTISLGSEVCSIAVQDDCIYASCVKGIVRVNWHEIS